MINSSKIRFIFLIAFLIVAGTLTLPQTVSSDEYNPDAFTAEQFVEYERQLNALLKTRRDEEQLFIAGVVRQVREGNIPSKLVSTSYSWVRTKRPNTNYPFIYFERVLRLQAQAAGLEDEIPVFDLSIYSSAGQNPFRTFTPSAGTRTIPERSVTPSVGQRIR